MSDQPSPAEAGRSLRDELLAAQDEINARMESDEPEVEVKAEAEPKAEPREEPKTEERPRDASGRFIPEEKSPVAESVAVVPPSAQAPAPISSDFIPAPQAWSNAEKAIWASVPAEAQKAILRREQDSHRAITVQDEDRNLGREFKRLTQPYEPMFQSVGASPVQGFQDYLRIAYVLNTGDPNAKRQALAQVAARHGIQLDGPQNTESGGEQNLPPALMQTISQIASQQQQQARELQAWKQQQQQSEMATTMSEIESFSKDPSHPFFESVREHMATLINAGAATSLQDAYDQAVWARPDTRERLIAEKTAPHLKQQESRAKTERARAKAVSVRGGTGGMPEPVRNPNASVREDLLAAMEETRGRI